MLLQRTITTLQARAKTPEQAKDFGTLGYLQWLAGLKWDASFIEEAHRALEMAKQFETTDPAIRVFCALLRAALADPIRALDLDLPERKRRGGARARRRSM